MYSQSSNISNIKSKSKRKIIEAPIYEISLSFNNNLFQTYLFEIFEKFTINLIPNEINYDNISFLNTIRISYNNELNFLIFLDKDTLIEWSQNENLINYIEKLSKITLNTNLTILLSEIPQNIKIKIEDENLTKEEIIFYLNTHLQVKVADLLNNNDLVDYISNYIEAIVNKENKSKLTFFDSKPVTSTNLCEIENITDEMSLMFVKHLMCIPGISERKAISIVKIYPNFSSIMQIYKSQEYNENEKENLLKEIEIEDRGKNTVQKFGGALSQKVYKTFYNLNPNTIIN